MIPSGRGSPSISHVRIAFWICALILGACQAWLDRHTMNNDGVSYLDMADAIARGDWTSGLNAFWSPLYPALLALALRVARPHPYAEAALVHVVNFAIYLLALLTLEFLLRALVRLQDERATECTRHGRVIMGELPLRILGYALFLLAALWHVTISVITPDMCILGLALFAAGLLLRIQLAGRTGPVPWLLYVALGVTLGLAYLAKAPMFPLAGAFLLVTLLLHRRGSAGSSVPRTLAALAAFALVATPFVIYLSVLKGRLTFGESGPLNYAWHVNGYPRGVEWQGQPAGSGDPVHPARQISVAPAAYEFAEPVGGTYPAYYDPSYWNEGMRPHLELRPQVRIVLRHVVAYSRLLSYVAVAWLALAYASGRGVALARDLGRYPALLLPAAAAFIMFSLVHVEPRYLAPFTILLCLGAFGALSLPASREAERYLSSVAFAVALGALSNTVYGLLKQAQWRQEDVAERAQRLVATELRRAYVSEGEPVAAIGPRYGVYWARLARLRVIAAVPVAEADRFWRADSAERARVLRALAGAGGRVVVSDNVPVGASASGWRPIAGTPHYVYDLAPGDSVNVQWQPERVSDSPASVPRVGSGHQLAAPRQVLRRELR